MGASATSGWENAGPQHTALARGRPRAGDPRSDAGRAGAGAQQPLHRPWCCCRPGSCGQCPGSSHTPAAGQRGRARVAREHVGSARRRQAGAGAQAQAGALAAPTGLAALRPSVCSMASRSSRLRPCTLSMCRGRAGVEHRLPPQARRSTARLPPQRADLCLACPASSAPAYPPNSPARGILERIGGGAGGLDAPLHCDSVAKHAVAEGVKPFVRPVGDCGRAVSGGGEGL